MDPMWLIILRVIERIFIYVGAVITIYLGYNLYKKGINKGRGDLQAKSKLGQIILSGTGPGLFFMVFGAVILLLGLYASKSKFQSSKIGVQEPNKLQSESGYSQEVLTESIIDKGPVIHFLSDEYFDLICAVLDSKFNQLQGELDMKFDDLSERIDKLTNTVPEEQSNIN